MLSVTERGEGRPLVLLPGFGLSAALMAAAFEPAFSAQQEVRRIYIDLPGVGRSPAVAPHSDAVLDAVCETIDRLVGTRSFLLAGWSYGGYLASGLVRRRPSHVTALLLICSGVKIDPASRDVSGVQASRPEVDWLADVPETLHGHLERAVGYQTREVGRRLATAFALSGPTDDEFLEQLRTSGYSLSDEASDQTYGGRVLMVTGRRDRIAGYRDQLTALGRYPHASYAAVADAGHYLPVEQPRAFAALMQTWLRG